MVALQEQVEQSKRIKGVARKLIPLQRLKNAPHNPPGRILAKNLRDLIDSMDMIGLLHPVTVSPAEEIIDGHRRVAAARILEWRDIECNVVEEDSAQVYASVNATPRKLSGNDALTVWLANPRAVQDKVNSRFGTMTNVLGVPLVKKLANAGYSVRVYQTAVRVCRYCEDTDPETVKKVVHWLLDTAVIGHVMKAMEAGHSPRIIMEAVRKGKPIVFRLAVGD